MCGSLVRIPLSTLTPRPQAMPLARMKSTSGSIPTAISTSSQAICSLLVVITALTCPFLPTISVISSPARTSIPSRRSSCNTISEATGSSTSDQSALQRQRAAANHHDAIDILQAAQDFLVVGNAAQCRDARQVESRTGERAGARAIGEQHLVIGNALAVVQMSEMLRGIYAYDAPRNEADALLPVIRRWPRPQLFLWQTPAEVVLERGTVVRRVGIIRNDRDRAGSILSAQQFGSGDPRNTVTDNYIRWLCAHSLLLLKETITFM